ncbi:MAG: DUF3822 family protein [Bacteroidales bacterium]|nr:DUF3822 family protein [Bacteroidales bacterium]
MSYKINSFIASNKDVASNEKRLSICLSSNGFSFSMLHADQLIMLCDISCDMKANMAAMMTTIKEVFNEVGLIPYALKETELVVPSGQFVWVPRHLFDEQRQRDCIEALSKVPSGYGVFSNLNLAVGAYMVFTADNSAVSAFKICIPGLKIRCQHDKLLSASVLENSDMKSLLLMNIREGKTDFEVVCNKKLQLSNTFDCANANETLYHALNITKQFHLEDAAMTVAVCGDIDRDSFSLMRGYFADMVLYNGAPLTLTVPEMQHIHLYKYAMILS